MTDPLRPSSALTRLRERIVKLERMQIEEITIATKSEEGQTRQWATQLAQVAGVLIQDLEFTAGALEHSGAEVDRLTRALDAYKASTASNAASAEKWERRCKACEGDLLTLTRERDEARAALAPSPSLDQ